MPIDSLHCYSLLITLHYYYLQAVREAATICSAPVTLTFDLLTLKVMSESRVTWATSVPILVFLDLSILDLGPLYATDRQTSDIRRHLLTSTGRGHNNNTVAHLSSCTLCVYISDGKITTSSTNVRVVVGSTATFECSTDSGLDIRWYYCSVPRCDESTVVYNGAELDPTLLARFNVTRLVAMSPARSQLTIAAAEVGDSGTYSCAEADTESDRLHFVLRVVGDALLTRCSHLPNLSADKSGPTMSPTFVADSTL